MSDMSGWYAFLLGIMAAFGWAIGNILVGVLGQILEPVGEVLRLFVRRHLRG